MSNRQASTIKTMIAIGKEEDEAKQFIRLSFGMHTTKARSKPLFPHLNSFKKKGCHDEKERKLLGEERRTLILQWLKETNAR